MKNTVIKLHMQIRKNLSVFVNSKSSAFSSMLNFSNTFDDERDYEPEDLDAHESVKTNNLNLNNKRVALANNSHIEASVEHEFGSFHRLPNELLLKLCSYLDYKSLIKLASVNRKCNAVAYDPRNWKTLSFSKWISSTSITLLAVVLDYL
jgi:hypothetical protein